jgi:hypothetical protein
VSLLKISTLQAQGKILPECALFGVFIVQIAILAIFDYHDL